MSPQPHARTRTQDLIDSLRQLGIGAEVSLPQIAVVGATSSGKSSLLSMISGVKLPSGSELTTRCPIELILRQSSSGDFEARVSVRDDTTSEPPTAGAFSLKSTSELETAIADAQRRMVMLLVGAQTNKQTNTSFSSLKG